MQEVASGTEGANPKSTKGTARHIPVPLTDRPLLFKVVHEETPCAIDAVASSVVGTAQLGFVLGVTGGYVEIMEAVGELAAFGILAGTRLSIAAAQFCLVAGGAEPRRHRGQWGLNQGKQGLGKRQASTA